MEEDMTEGYSEPCERCGSVCWAVSDGWLFFCKRCLNVTERTKEVEDVDALVFSGRISSISSEKRRSREKQAAQNWMVCEGFQLILKCQAEALVGLGVCPQIKTDVLWVFWKRYLQKTNQAYTTNPVHSISSVDKRRDGEINSKTGHLCDGTASPCSGSMDAEYYFQQNQKSNRMSMPRTLAFCHLALLWVREGITLADLLRLVTKGHVPYTNAHELFPEHMRFFGKDALIFRVESVPSYRNVHVEAVELARLIGLPAFPPVSPDCLLHPSLLSLRFLMDANLPDQLHTLVRIIIQKTGMGKDNFLTFDPPNKRSTLLCYDLEAAALIVVSMKLLFRLDDKMTWKLPMKVDKKAKDELKKKTKKGAKMFKLRRWYTIVQRALEQAREKEMLAETTKQWKSEKPIIPSLKHKNTVLKRKRVVDQLQSTFQALSGSAPVQHVSSPSSFLFLWGDEDGADGPSLRHECLDDLIMEQKEILQFVNLKYWHTSLRVCAGRTCSDHFWELEPTLPRMYMWVLGFFCFILGVEAAQLHSAVVQVERRFLTKLTKKTKVKKPKKKKTKTQRTVSK